MRARRPRPARTPSRVANQLSVLLLLALGSASACAAEVNTLEGDEGAAATGSDPEPSAGTSGSAGASSGGKPSTGGTPGTSGSATTAGTNATAGSGGKVGGAFGGTGSMGGSSAGTAGSGGTAGSAGASGGTAGKGGTGGTAGSGGKGGTGGTAGSGGKGGTGGTAGTGGSGTTTGCLKDWDSDPCDTCSTQTQGDKLACVEILDCYAANSCGPTTCANNDDKCGVNKIAKGTAGYPIAADVYNCLCK